MWAPTPGSPIGRINGKQYALMFYKDPDFEGYVTILLVDAWDGKDNWNGILNLFPMQLEVELFKKIAAMGGFVAWVDSVLAAVCTYLAALPPPIVPTDDPKTFSEVEAWFIKNTEFAMQDGVLKIQRKA